MSDDSKFERVLASLNDAMLDDVHWPAASAGREPRPGQARDPLSALPTPSGFNGGFCYVRTGYRWRPVG